MQSITWIEESGYAPELHRYPNFPKCFEVDASGRPAPRFCFNEPEYWTWNLSIVEDYAKSYDRGGLAWRSERHGPLNILMQGPVRPDAITCLYPHFQAIAQNRGIEVRRAQEGYRKAIDWSSKVASRNRSRDGALVSRDFHSSTLNCSHGRHYGWGESAPALSQQLRRGQGVQSRS